MVGRTVLHYEISTELGAGGMGRVYLARDTRTQRSVAIKFLGADAMGSVGSERLRREAQAASRLSHSGIVTVFALEEAHGELFLVEEYVEGETLAHRLQRGPLGSQEALRLARELSAALAHAHQRGVLHRDLKPANILVASDGSFKIADFGIARMEGMPTMTTATALLGTLHYIAPERVRGARGDARADLFALGAILYEAMSGRQAFVGASEAEVLFAVINEDPPALEVRGATSEKLVPLVRQLLAKEPQQRPASAEVVAGILAGLEGTASRAEIETAARPRTAWGWLWGAAAGLLLAVVLLFDVAGMRTLLFQGRGPQRTPSIAVLPLENFSGDPEQQYFADGMTEQLITSLAQIGGLRVISRTSVMGFKGTKRPLPEIGRKLNVDVIVEGSVQRSGDRVRITAQLIRVASDQHIWAQSYERDLRDALVLQEEVAGAIAKEVRVHLTPRQHQKVASARTVSPKGYELYLRALDAYRRWDKRSQQAALEFLNQAIKDDSTYAPAWAAMGLVYMDFPGQFGTPEQDVARGRNAVERALALDPDLGLAHSVKAQIEYRQDWNWAAAERGYQRAIELTPSLFEAHHLYSHLLMDQGRVGESLEQSRSALALDPLNTAATLHMGWHYLYAGQFERAIPEYEATLRLDPSYSAAYMQLSWVYALTHRHDEAIAAFRKWRELTGSTDTLSYAAMLAATRGRSEEVQRLLPELIAGASRGEQPAYNVATIFALLGRKDDAFDWLDRSFKKHEDSLTGLKQDPFLVMLRPDPRFAALLRRIGLPG